MGRVVIEMCQTTSSRCIGSGRGRAGIRLEQEPRTLIEAAAAYSAAEKFAVAKWSQSLTPPGLQTDAALLIREDRDR